MLLLLDTILEVRSTEEMLLAWFDKELALERLAPENLVLELENTLLDELVGCGNSTSAPRNATGG